MQTNETIDQQAEADVTTEESVAETSTAEVTDQPLAAETAASEAVEVLAAEPAAAADVAEPTVAEVETPVGEPVQAEALAADDAAATQAEADEPASAVPPVDTVPVAEVSAEAVETVVDAPEDAGQPVADAATSADGASAEAAVAPAEDATNAAEPVAEAATAESIGAEPHAEGAEHEAEHAEHDGDKRPAKFDPAAAEALIGEVEAAPHKVYHLGKVRKALAGAGESELGVRLKALEGEIVAQIESRKAAKEALCERAEALKDSNAWKATGEAYKALFEEWRTVGAAGRQLDDELWARFNAARGAFNERRSKHFAEREQVWGENKAKKEALVAEAEALADSTDWKSTADKIRDLQARWKEVGSAGRERDEALWAKFNGAKQRFFDARAAVWEEHRKQKEALVQEAEALKDSDDWRTVGEAMKALQATWKTIGSAGREQEDELWRRFRAATQQFFERRGSAFAERRESERENMSSKLELCQRAEALVYSGDVLAAAREAKELQARWKETGPVPREQSEALWQRFRAACDKIFENAHGERDRQQNEWHLRMKDALGRKREQLVALRESIAHDEANMARWRDSLSNLKPGGKSEEIGKSLEDKILDVMDRIREKNGRVEELRSSINDIEAKLRE